MDEISSYQTSPSYSVPLPTVFTGTFSKYWDMTSSSRSVALPLAAQILRKTTLTSYRGQQYVYIRPPPAAAPAGGRHGGRAGCDGKTIAHAHKKYCVLESLAWSSSLQPPREFRSFHSSSPSSRRLLPLWNVAFLFSCTVCVHYLPHFMFVDILCKLQ